MNSSATPNFEEFFFRERVKNFLLKNNLVEIQKNKVLIKYVGWCRIFGHDDFLGLRECGCVTYAYVNDITCPRIISVYPYLKINEIIGKEFEIKLMVNTILLEHLSDGNAYLLSYGAIKKKIEYATDLFIL